MTDAPSDPQVIADAAAALRAGLVVAFPTETVYGLGADALNEAAVREVFRLKGRPASNPLIVHVSDDAMARGNGHPGAIPIVARWPDEAAALAEAFWPGPLTLVLPKADAVPSIVTAGGPSVAVRCPDHPVALALLRAFGGPLVGPSANPSGRVSPTTAEHVREGFSTGVLVLDGGACRVGIESTVVALTRSSPRVLRPGAVSREEIARVLGRAVEAGPGMGGAVLESPGMLERHYSPRTHAVVFDSKEWARVEERMTRERRIAVVTPEDRPVPPPHIRIDMPRGAAEYAATLYSALREADACGATLIAIELPAVDVAGVWEAVGDRLRRAAGPWPG